MASILDTLKDAQGGMKKSADWYRRNVRSIADNVTARRLMNQGKLIGRDNYLMSVGEEDDESSIQTAFIKQFYKVTP